MPLGYIDYNQLELWIVALEAHDQAYLDARARGEYVHGLFYEAFYKQPFFTPGMPKVKKNMLPDIPPKNLLRAKAIPHGLNYLRSWKSLAKEWKITEEEAFKMYKVYFDLHHWVKEWHNKLEFEVNRNHLLRNRFGTIRHYPFADSSIANFIGQSTGADILKRSLYRGRKHLSLPDRILTPNHDAFLVQARWETAEEAFTHIQEEMEQPIPLYDGFSFKTEMQIGMNWGEMRVVEVANLKEKLNVLQAKANNRD
jgi:DNA polymerase I-like protein with 3'-5' exonuclease and polymerase domains